MKKPKKKSAEVHWKLREGAVDTSGEHCELSFGQADASDSTLVLIARVASPKRRVFVVDFAVDSTDPKYAQMVAAVRRELNFYLIELGEENPWAYARYHCNTAANIYSDVHWSFSTASKTADESG